MPQPLPRNILGEIRAKMHDSRTLKHSIADVVDNSIDGGANHVDIWLGTMSPHRPDPLERYCQYVRIDDDGHGIRIDDLGRVIQFNTSREYRDTDLGSFGLGLKDALLAHGSEITVLSRREGKDWGLVRLSLELSKHAEEWTWVDNEELKLAMASWQSGDFESPELPPHWWTTSLQEAVFEIEQRPKGTIVLLEFLHRRAVQEEADDLLALLDEEEEGPIEENQEQTDVDEQEIESQTGTIQAWLELTFCQYLQGIDIGTRSKSSPLTMRINGQPLTPLDPFFRDQIGVGDFDGQQGTLVSNYDFEYKGLSLTIERYIIPHKDKQDDLHSPTTLTRLKTATGLEATALQGIFVTRNGRTLDGPWNGVWRRSGMAMGTNHHNVCRWNLVLPSGSIEFEELVPPDKFKVNLDYMNSDILKAKNERLLWHYQDTFDYGGGELNRLQDPLYNQRGRARNDSKDIILLCEEEGCASRRIPWNQPYCPEHQFTRCQAEGCQTQVGEAGQFCEACLNSVCEFEGCSSMKEIDAYCITHSQDECEIEGCAQLSAVGSGECTQHLSTQCNEAQCTSQQQQGFLKCTEHLKITISGVEVSAQNQGASIQIDGQTLQLNPDSHDFSKLIHFLQTVR